MDYDFTCSTVSFYVGKNKKSKTRFLIHIVTPISLGQMKFWRCEKLKEIYYNISSSNFIRQ